MTRFLSAPDLRRSYAVAADWLEMLALARKEEPSSDADLLHTLEILEDRAATEAIEFPAEIDDPDIIDQATERSLDAVFEEIHRRHQALGSYYPFDVAIERRRIGISLADQVDDQPTRYGRDIYVACLLMSAIRAGILDARQAKIPVDPTMGNLFQICATLAAAGYLIGDAYWFGHPRPDETPILQAVVALTELVGVGTASLQRPLGETKYAKDCGVDVVAWRDHPDRRPAKLILYGQCASGTNWEGKPVKGKVDRLDGYYTVTPSKHWTPALFTPFPVYMEKENAHNLWSEEEISGFYRQHESEHGLIVDRLRIVVWSVEALRNLQPSAKNAADRLDDLFEWSALAIARAQEAA